VQVGVARGICIVSSFSKEGRNATTNQHVKTMYGCQRQIKLGGPDGWERFRVAVSAAAKSGPKHRTAKQAKKAKH